MKRTALFIAILIMTALYGSFLAVDIHSGFSDNMYSKTVRYMCILTCLVFVFRAGDDGHNRRDLKLIGLAFLFTALADFTMSIICCYSFTNFEFCTNFKTYKFGIGILFFFIVQIIYIIRHKQNFKWSKKEVITPLIIFGIMIFKVVPQGEKLLQEGGTYNYILLVVVSFYATALCISLWMAIGTIWRNYFPKQTAWMIAIGMSLFFLCDNSLGRFVVYPESVPKKNEAGFIKFKQNVNTAQISYTEDQVSVYTNAENMQKIEIPYTLKSIFGILVWFFYLPAQVLLMLSAYKPEFLQSIFGLLKTNVNRGP